VIDRLVRRRIMRTISRLVVTALTLGAMTGCSVYQDFTTSGFAKQEPDAIVAAASKAMLDVTSMRLTGQVRSHGRSVFVDISVAEGDLCRGTMRIEGANVDIRRVGAKAWVRGESGPGAAAKAPAGMWVPTDDKAVLQLCDLRTQLKEFTVADPGEEGRAGTTDDLEAYVPSTVGEETSLDGVKVVPLSGRPGGEHEETSWVRVDAPHYVVRIESTSANNGGSLYYSAFNDEVLVEAPDRKDVLRP
jgi:hypothetical protein